MVLRKQRDGMFSLAARLWWFWCISTLLIVALADEQVDQSDQLGLIDQIELLEAIDEQQPQPQIPQQSPRPFFQPRPGQQQQSSAQIPGGQQGQPSQPSPRPVGLFPFFQPRPRESAPAALPAQLPRPAPFGFFQPRPRESAGAGQPAQSPRPGLFQPRPAQAQSPRESSPPEQPERPRPKSQQLPLPRPQLQPQPPRQPSRPSDARCWKNVACNGPAKSAFEGPWELNNFAPSTRSVRPKRILNAAGKFIAYYTPASTSELRGNGSVVVLDFGKEVGGLITLDFSSTGRASLGLAFTESIKWIGAKSDLSNGGMRGPDGAIYHQINGATYDERYVMPDKYMRGGFRYMTLFLRDTNSRVNVRLFNIEAQISFQPTWPDMRAYQGYFHSSDHLLNQLWYSGAYTLQVNCIPTNTGRHVPYLAQGWANDGAIGPGDTILVDGAKRDRTVWPGDMGTAVPSSFVSLGDLESIKNALQVMYDYQERDGAFPQSGPPLLQKVSDTYHLWTLIGTYNYVLYSDDMEFIYKNWAKYTYALDYALRKINSRGIFRTSNPRDWARWNEEGENSAANMILYRTLVTASILAKWQPNIAPAVSAAYATRAEALKTAINARLYDTQRRAFRDSTTKPNLYPQDANAYAILFEVVTGDRARDVSDSLMRNWTPIGPQSPELPGNISPFITSIELQAHFALGDTSKALDLLYRTWGWYQTNPNGTESTMIEGYRTDGSFGYRAERGYGNDASYTSHAHAWSAGPTSALTNYIAGLDLVERAGSRWTLSPQFGYLSFAEAGFTTRLGKYRTKWERQGNGYDVYIDTPASTTGNVSLLALMSNVTIVEYNGTRREFDVRKRDNDGINIKFDLKGGTWFIKVRELETNATAEAEEKEPEGNVPVRDPGSRPRENEGSKSPPVPPPPAVPVGSQAKGPDGNLTVAPSTDTPKDPQGNSSMVPRPGPLVAPIPPPWEQVLDYECEGVCGIGVEQNVKTLVI